jgi:hypothetical protein
MKELELIWEAFQFFHGSFQLLLKGCKDRKSEQQKLQKYETFNNKGVDR